MHASDIYQSNRSTQRAAARFSGIYGCTGQLHARIGAGTFDVLLAPDGARQIESAHGADWWVGTAADEGQTHQLWRSDAGFAAVFGYPRGSGVLAAQIERLGLGRALIEEYRDSGPAVLDRMTGPFALAIHLHDERRTLLATDRLGRCPLHYMCADQSTLFASNLNFFRFIEGIDLEIDRQSIYDYLYFHVIPSPRTIYANVSKLAPGMCLELGDGCGQPRCYWTPVYTREHERLDVDECAAEFRDLVRGSIAREAASPGAVGCFLSGGTDSSTVAGYLGDVTGRPAPTFSIGFDEPGFDEMGYARIAAEHFQTEHHEYYVTPNDILELLPRIASFYGEPFGNSSVVPAFFCAKLAASLGIRKLLGGDGGDELFGGNERYATQVLFSWYFALPEALRRGFVEPILEHFPLGDRIPPVRKLQRYVEQALEPMPQRLQTYNHLRLIGDQRIFEPGFLGIVDCIAPERALSEVYNQAKADHIINKMLALDMKFTLADNDLPKVTVSCDAAGVAAAYPFLDDELFAFAAALPASFKVRGLTLRYFFKRALQDFLPGQIIRKKKHGFGLPFGPWLERHRQLREFSFDTLNGLKTRGIISGKFIDELRDRKIAEHANYFGGFVWILVILESWFELDAATRSIPGRQL